MLLLDTEVTCYHTYIIYLIFNSPVTCGYGKIVKVKGAQQHVGRCRFLKAKSSLEKRLYGKQLLAEERQDKKKSASFSCILWSFCKSRQFDRPLAMS